MDAPEQVTSLQMKSVIGSGVAGTEVFLVVKKIERIEVDTLLSFELYNSKNFAPVKRKSLAGYGL
jgi:hypothetical protein